MPANQVRWWHDTVASGVQTSPFMREAPSLDSLARRPMNRSCRPCQLPQASSHILQTITSPPLSTHKLP